jgi:hypothetical protein
LSEGISGKRDEKRKDTGMKRMEVYCICTYEDSIKKPTKHCLRFWEGKWERGEWWAYIGGSKLV